MALKRNKNSFCKLGIVSNKPKYKRLWNKPSENSTRILLPTIDPRTELKFELLQLEWKILELPHL